MSFADADLYDRFVGRYGPALSAAFLDAAGVRAGQRAIDVGCGPGALTTALVERLGTDAVRAVDPSPSFAAACRERTGADVREGRAEALPFEDGSADVVLSQLVLNFVGDPDAALAEQLRVAVPGATIGAAVWDYAGEMRLLRAFWDAAAATDPAAAGRDEGRTMRLCRPGELEALWRSAGLDDVRVTGLDVEARWPRFDDLWGALEGGVGPAGAWVASCDAEGRRRLREAFHAALGSPTGAFTVSARAWCALGTVPAGSG